MPFSTLKILIQEKPEKDRDIPFLTILRHIRHLLFMYHEITFPVRFVIPDCRYYRQEIMFNNETS